RSVCGHCRQKPARLPPSRTDRRESVIVLLPPALLRWRGSTARRCKGIADRDHVEPRAEDLAGAEAFTNGMGDADVGAGHVFAVVDVEIAVVDVEISNGQIQVGGVLCRRTLWLAFDEKIGVLEIDPI